MDAVATSTSTSRSGPPGRKSRKCRPHVFVLGSFGVVTRSDPYQAARETVDGGGL